MTTMRSILAEVAARTQVPIDDLCGPSRRKKIVSARQEAMARMYATGRYSTTQIGRLFGRDHTTVLWALDRHAQRVGVERARFRTGPRAA